KRQRGGKEEYFTRDLFYFLRDLKRNNNRDWFQRNKDRYETCVRDPILRFIADVGPRIKELSPHFVADASPTGPCDVCKAQLGVWTVVVPKKEPPAKMSSTSKQPSASIAEASTHIHSNSKPGTGKF